MIQSLLNPVLALLTEYIKSNSPKKTGLNLVRTSCRTIWKFNVQTPGCCERLFNGICVFVVVVPKLFKFSENAVPVYFAILSNRRGYLVSLCIWVGMISFSCRRRHSGLLSAS